MSTPAATTPDAPRPNDGWLDAYRACRLCPRNCGVDRTAGQTGVCGQTAVCRIASIAPHHGEEPPFSGHRGSGTLFFTGCSCRCFFCQNHQISHGNTGHDYSEEALFRAVVRLVSRGVHNLNLVTPSHAGPHVRRLCRALRSEGIDLPVIYNCSGYDHAAIIREVAQEIPIFLPDMKFADGELARRCMGDADYPRIAMAAIAAMVESRGFLHPWDETGTQPAVEGVLVRHLVLPGHTRNSLDVLTRLRETFGPDLPISVMSQYSPTPLCRRHGLLTTPLPMGEYEQVLQHVEALGFTHAFIQPERGDDGFIPDFEDDTDPFPGNAQHSAG